MSGGAVAHPVHVGHDVGVAGDIDHVAFARDHVPGLAAGVDRPAARSTRRNGWR